MNAPDISVVIPLANDAAALRECLSSVTGAPNEIIVVEAETEDKTVTTVAAANARVFSYSEPHRARQMNYGAAQARGRILLFLHADTLLPPQALVKIIWAIERCGAVGGGFSRRYRSRSLILALTCRLADVRNRMVGWHLGDQAIFVRRDIFERLGGYRDLLAFEDLDFSRRLRGMGKIVTLNPPVHSSARRFAQKGPLRTTWNDLLLTCRYLAGADPNGLCQAASDRIRTLQTYERLS
jgi:rSAM/selenodomain-associated transferase 2